MEAPMRRFAMTAAAVAAFVLLGSSARADITVCNQFRAPVKVALAYEDQGTFTAAGWWRVEPDACEPVDFAFQGAKLYYAADSDKYKDGRFTKQDHWGNKVKLYVKRGQFTIENADRPRGGAKAEMFSSTDIPQPGAGQTSPSIKLTFTSGSTIITTGRGK
jgi:uncharacterized membrane protein